MGEVEEAASQAGGARRNGVQSKAAARLDPLVKRMRLI
jgi:hypothetical protein